MPLVCNSVRQNVLFRQNKFGPGVIAMRTPPTLADAVGVAPFGEAARGVQVRLAGVVVVN